ncbi:hypothetical protein V5F77_00185 [Xanthobacter sp. DSM 24535]
MFHVKHPDGEEEPGVLAAISHCSGRNLRFSAEVLHGEQISAGEIIARE